MKKFIALCLAFCLMFLAGGTGFAAPNGEKILVAYFSRTGEEYMGTIAKGNTEIVAEIIAKKVGGDLFKITPSKDYPFDYEECKTVASREKATKARPELASTVKNFQDYDTIFIGYPIWYGDMPMPVYTFVESYDFSGKKIIPFCTHGGSGLSSTDQSLTLLCPNAKILQGFESRGVSAQKNFTQTEEKISEWLAKLNLQ